MSCFECVRAITCCGFCCGIVSSISEICRGIRSVKEDIVENIENKFDYKKMYFVHKQDDLYEDLRNNEIVKITFFNEQKLDKTKTL